MIRLCSVKKDVEGGEDLRTASATADCHTMRIRMQSFRCHSDLWLLMDGKPHFSPPAFYFDDRPLSLAVLYRDTRDAAHFPSAVSIRVARRHLTFTQAAEELGSIAAVPGYRIPLTVSSILLPA